MAVSYYSATLAKFASHSRMEILGELTRNHRHDLEHQQRDAWLTQVDVLKEQLAGFPDGHIHFEFIIPRMGSRTKINLEKGERWFCDEAEAIAAGWRAPIWGN